MKRHTSWHHRKPRFLNGTSEARNMIELPVVAHQAWHTLFQAQTPERIAYLISTFYLDPDWEMVAVKKSERIEEGL